MTDRQSELVAVGVLAASLGGALYLSWVDRAKTAAPAPAPGPAPTCPSGWTLNGGSCCPPPHLGLSCRPLAPASGGPVLRSVSF